MFTNGSSFVYKVLLKRFFLNVDFQIICFSLLTGNQNRDPVILKRIILIGLYKKNFLDRIFSLKI
jgi:hypothetical protein